MDWLPHIVALLALAAWLAPLAIAWPTFDPTCGCCAGDEPCYACDQCYEGKAPDEYTAYLAGFAATYGSPWGILDGTHVLPKGHFVSDTAHCYWLLCLGEVTVTGHLVIPDGTYQVVLWKDVLGNDATPSAPHNVYVSLMPTSYDCEAEPFEDTTTGVYWGQFGWTSEPCMGLVDEPADTWLTDGFLGVNEPGLTIELTSGTTCTPAA